MWYDLDFSDVIDVRKQFYKETSKYQMIPSSVTELAWLDKVKENNPTLIIAEGLTMYLTENQMKELLLAFQQKFGQVEFIFDAYSRSAVKMSKWKNPVNKMGATIRWGLDEPKLIEQYAKGIRHIQTQYFTGGERIKQLDKRTRFLFNSLYGNKWANNLYRIYTFQITQA